MGFFKSSTAKGQAAEVEAAERHRLATSETPDTPEALLAEAHADTLHDAFEAQHGAGHHRFL
ncbi:hypothetical protein ACFU98_35245 [Streptomyces sp. NPDC057575]|uniref:hypothetical protein n=1 Tax=unclassified Streptomyces TaxID=2593676 RepID=UPI0036A28497